MKSRGLLFVTGVLVISACCALACIGIFGLAALTAIENNPLEIGDAVGVIYVEGPIVMGAPLSDFSAADAAYSETIIEYLRKAQKDSAVKAIVLRVESPGGSVVASQEIYDEVMATQKKGKPVIASFGEISASGGYYISAGADKIYVHPATITGSIGVISVLTNIEGLTDKLGVKMVVIKSGPHKDESYGFRDLSPEERVNWQKQIDEAYEDFVSIVAAGRKLDKDKVKKLADGSVYSGKQAKELGLADEIGNLEAAVAAAGKAGNIPGKPRTIKYRPTQGLFGSLSSAVGQNLGTKNLLDLFSARQMGRLMYLYVAP